VPTETNPPASLCLVMTELPSARTSAIGKPSLVIPGTSAKKVVAAGRLRAALDDVAGDDCSGQAVPVVPPPAEVPGSWANDERKRRVTRDKPRCPLLL